MKARLLLILLPLLLSVPTPVAAQPCAGAKYADHPALVAECQHNQIVNHHRSPSYKAPETETPWQTPTPHPTGIPVPVEPTPPYP